MRRAALLLLGGLAGCGAPEPGVDGLLLVVVDTLRADRVSAAGYPRPTTPNLDGLAARGALFTECVAHAPWTRPSVASLMTGRLPTATGLTCHEFRLPKGSCDVLHPELETLAECFASAGFATGGVVANINVDPVFGFDQGFGRYISIPALQAADPAWRMGRGWLEDTTPAVGDAAIGWLETHGGDGPFLLYLHYLDPHEPYLPEPDDAALFDPATYGDLPEEHRASAAAYDAEVRGVDRDLGRVLAALERLGLRDRTAVVVTSDHGEEFGEHGGAYHGWTLYEEQLRVPLAIVAPGLTAPDTVLTDAVGLVDLMPTLLELFDVPAPPGLQGRSLAPLLRGELLPPLDAVVERGYRPYAGLRRAGGAKLVVDLEEGTRWLYDLAVDPGELRAAANPDAALLAELDAALRERLAESEALRLTLGEVADVSLTPEQIEQLGAIGYGDQD